ncbi:CRE-PRP-21 protein [Caenorhabditis remanei]|uniref:CRE-PRP-21 protein n=1 Tax=Caenorhabditis remanei TaxID=31234 RepID=E3N371_CAERE|nr:CRE-PRP-21 protein [Caenorhabditis remanei]
MLSRVSNREEDSMNNEPTLSGKTIIGLINPPPDIRTIVDKTARFVAKNGVDFENKIREKEAKNPKFNFLSITDPYHAYYKKMVYDFSEGRVEAPKVPQAVKEHVKKAEFVPSAPPPAYEFSADPSTINAYDLDLIRLVALFVARNGRQFLTQLMTREARNYQFDFLKPAHCNFTYFTKLVEQYQKVLVPATNVVNQLLDDASNKKRLLEDINYRVSWEKHQKGLKDREEAEAEKERMAYAQIDWHDFVVVQTVDFQPGDSSQLPPLCTPKDVGARILLEARNEMQKAAAEMQEMDMEESDSEDEDVGDKTAPESSFTAPLPPTKQKDVIVRDYDPKRNQPTTQKKAVENWIISPLTGERIPSDKLAEHVRYNTVDSQYKEDRDRHIGERSTEEPVLALGADISRNLGQFAERRTDIFGVGGEQTMIGKKLGEEDNSQQGQSNKLIWDGTEETRDMITRAVQNQVTIDQQINEIHRQHGFIADPSKEKIGAQQQLPRHQTTQGNVTITQGIANLPGQMPWPGGPGGPPMGMMPPGGQGLPPHMRPPMEFGGGGPPAKRARTEEDLEPEEEWLKKVNGTIELIVQLPQAPENGMDGSFVQFSVQVTAPMSELKQQIQDRYGMGIGKQKLLSEGFFVKDNLSAAYYNLHNRSLIVLQVKERGGKKK